MQLGEFFKRLASTRIGIDKLAPPQSKLPRVQLLTICAVVFLISLGVRLLYWQDNYPDLLRGKSAPGGLQMMAPSYHDEAQRIVDDGGILFPRNPVDPSDATMLVHPPGYPILMVAAFKVSHAQDSKHGLVEQDSNLRIVQIISDALSSVVIFLIALELFTLGIAVIGAMLSSFSPHLGYYSLMFGPDSLSVLFILLAVYVLIRASKQRRFIFVLTAGVLIGVSCWFRSNALLLAPFLGLITPVLFDRGKRLRYSLALVCATGVIIAPIVIRNWIVFHRFVPLSATAGRLLLEGFANFDKEDGFGQPSDEDEAAAQEAVQFGRADYAASLWKPDGIDRDRARFARGVSVIRSHPGWFLGVMLRRIKLMLRYNDSQPQEPFNVTVAPTLSESANFGHDLEITDEASPSSSRSPGQLFTNGSSISERAQTAIQDNGEMVQINTAGTQIGDLFASESIAVKKNTDYLLRLAVSLEQGSANIKVGIADPRIALALVSASYALRDRKRKPKELDAAQPTALTEHPLRILVVPFASGDNTQVKLLVHKTNPDATILKLGPAEMFESGPTPYLWTRYPRALIRGIQKNLFKTNVARLLIVIGIVLLALARHGRALAVLLIVPVYFLVVQSPLHTEYRYILAIHYFLFVIAAVTIYRAGSIIGQVGRQGWLFARTQSARLANTRREG